MLCSVMRSVYFRLSMFVAEAWVVFFLLTLHILILFIRSLRRQHRPFQFHTANTHPHNPGMFATRLPAARHRPSWLPLNPRRSRTHTSGGVKRHFYNESIEHNQARSLHAPLPSSADPASKIRMILLGPPVGIHSFPLLQNKIRKGYLLTCSILLFCAGIGERNALYQADGHL
jgi:hypothetical protein